MQIGKKKLSATLYFINLNHVKSIFLHHLVLHTLTCDFSNVACAGRCATVVGRRESRSAVSAGSVLPRHVIAARIQTLLPA